MIEIEDGIIYYASEYSNYHDLILTTYTSCGLCHGDSFTGTKICAKCRQLTPGNLTFCCDHCGRKTHMKGICTVCKQHSPIYRFGISPLSYVEGGKQLVQYFKTNDSYLKDFLADLVTAKIVGCPPIDIVVAVPADEEDELDRGYNPSGILGKAVAKRIHRPYADCMLKMFPTQEQKILSYSERAKNLRGAFKVLSPEAVKGKRVLLIDDILTSGATANEMTRVLKIAGAKYVIVATAASTPDPEVKLSELDWFPVRASKAGKQFKPKVSLVRKGSEIFEDDTEADRLETTRTDCEVHYNKDPKPKKDKAGKGKTDTNPTDGEAGKGTPMDGETGNAPPKKLPPKESFISRLLNRKNHKD